MGYMISTLANLPMESGISFWVFLLGRRFWDKGFRHRIQENFSRLAQELGPHAAVVTGHEGVNLVPELVDAAKNRPDLSRIVSQTDSCADEGGILLLGAHPAQLGPDDLLLFSPFEHLDRAFGGVERFLDELCAYTRGSNPRFLSRFEEKPDIFMNVLDILQLTPNLFGIGVNIKAAIAKIRGPR